MMEKRKKEKPKFTLTSAQEVSYQSDFKKADRAGGYNERRSKH
ncbi:YfhE family protein [Neobacillus sp. PS3-40]|nr:YfhE family protein [Neobacillus sp. PS3-40]WML46465.1 YfhE family protein [Neobacillus sp. PS3-40]